MNENGALLFPPQARRQPRRPARSRRRQRRKPRAARPRALRRGPLGKAALRGRADGCRTADRRRRALSAPRRAAAERVDRHELPPLGRAPPTGAQPRDRRSRSLAAPRDRRSRALAARRASRSRARRAARSSLSLARRERGGDVHPASWCGLVSGVEGGGPDRDATALVVSLCRPSSPRCSPRGATPSASRSVVMMCCVSVRIASLNNTE